MFRVLLPGFIVAIFAVESQAAKSVSRVQDLDYGVALFAHYQQDYFTALSELLIAEEKQSIDYHAEFAQVLRGGIYLSYGMDSEAEVLFTNIIEADNAEIRKGKSASGKLLGKSRKASKENIARAWFYLGRLLYKKGDYAAAEKYFAKVGRSLTKALYPELAFLKASARQRISGSIDHSKDAGFNPKLDQHSSWFFYTRYNQLLEQLASLRGEKLESLPAPKAVQDIANKMDALANSIGSSPQLFDSQELLALRDQIYTTAGFLYLQYDYDKQAIRSFKRVSQNSVLVGQALLGYGWAAVNSGDYSAALAPWQVLAGRSMVESTTHEALLAVPFVYEKIGANAAALAAYDSAATALQTELDLLEKVSRTVYAIDVETLSSFYSHEAVTWLEEETLRSVAVDSAEPEKTISDELLEDRMAELMSQNAFSVLEKQRQDIQWLRASLEKWQLDLATIRFVVEERQQRAATAVSLDARQILQQRVTKNSGLRDVLAEQIMRAQQLASTNDLTLLMTPKEKQIKTRITKAAETAARIQQTVDRYAKHVTAQGEIERIVSGESFALNTKKIDWSAGLLDWAVSDTASQRHWTAEKQLREIDNLLQDASDASTDLEQIASHTVQQTEVRQQAAMIDQSIADLHRQALTLAARIDEKMKQLLVIEIQRLKKQATTYLAHASLARARLLDTISEQGGAIDAASHNKSNEQAAM